MLVLVLQGIVCLLLWCFCCFSDLPSDVSYYSVDLYNRNKRSKDVLVGMYRVSYLLLQLNQSDFIQWNPVNATTTGA